MVASSLREVSCAAGVIAAEGAEVFSAADGGGCAQADNAMALRNHVPMCRANVILEFPADWLSAYQYRYRSVEFKGLLRPQLVAAPLAAKEDSSAAPWRWGLRRSSVWDGPTVLPGRGQKALQDICHLSGIFATNF